MPDRSIVHLPEKAGCFCYMPARMVKSNHTNVKER